MITSFHMHPDTLNAKIKDIYMNRRNRLELAMQLDEMIDQIIAKQPTKGLYLYGEFGTGKSFILGAVSYAHLTLPTIIPECRSRWSPYH